MTWEEQAIMTFLKASPETAFNRKEIAKKAVKRRIYEENPDWNLAPLASLLNQELIQKDDSGHFRFIKGY